MTRVWSYSARDLAGVFGIDWQDSGGVNRFELVLESGKVGVVDLAKIPVFFTIKGSS